MKRSALFATTCLSTTLLAGGLFSIGLTLSSPALAACSPSFPTSGTAGNLSSITCSGTLSGSFGSSNLNYVSGVFDSTFSGNGNLFVGTGNVIQFDGTVSASSGDALFLSGSNNTVTVNGSVKAFSSSKGIKSSSSGTKITVNGLVQSDLSSAIKVGDNPNNISQYVDQNAGQATILINSGGRVSSSTSSTDKTITLHGAGNTVTNYGTITGSVEAGSQSTMSNYGQVTGSVGMFNGSNTFEWATGSSVGGTITALGSNNTFRLIGSGTDSFDVSKVGGSSGTSGSTASYSGFDNYEKDGTGTWTLTGTASGNGSTTVKAGTIAWNANTVNTPVSVLVGAMVKGTGRIGSLDNAGTVAPGNSIGTLSVSGNYTQRSTGTLQIEISPSQADKLVVGGAASLDGNLAVLPDTGTYSSGTKYPIITAQSVSGTFKAVSVSNSERLGGLSVGVTYLGNEVDLELMAPLAASARQQEESTKVVAPEVTRQAGRMQTTIIGSHIASILFPPDFARAGSAGTGSSAPAGSGKDTDKKKDRKTSDAGTTGLAAGEAAGGGGYDLKGLSAWGDASLALLDNTDSASKYNGLHKAATLGVDYRVNDQLVTGFAFSPDQADINLRSVNGNRTSTGISGSAYAGYKFDDTYALSAIAGYGRAFNFTRQPVAGVDVKDNYDTNRYLAQLSFSAAYLLEDNLRLIPSLSYTHSVESESRHYSSDGAEIKIASVRLGTVKAGAQLEYAVTEQIVPFVTGGVERDLLSSSGSQRQGYSVGGGVMAPLDDSLTLGLVASTDFGRGAQSATQIAANIRYSW